MAENTQTATISEPVVAVGVIKYLFAKLTDQQRAEVVRDYCCYCWKKLNGPCGCMTCK